MSANSKPFSINAQSMKKFQQSMNYEIIQCNFCFESWPVKLEQLCFKKVVCIFQSV